MHAGGLVWRGFTINMRKFILHVHHLRDEGLCILVHTSQWKLDCAWFGMNTPIWDANGIEYKPCM